MDEISINWKKRRDVLDREGFDVSPIWYLDPSVTFIVKNVKESS